MDDTSTPLGSWDLINKLDDLIHNAKAVPLTGQVRIDREEFYAILDELRAVLPEEMRRARDAGGTSSSSS